MSDEWIKMAILENSGSPGNPGSEGPKSGYKGDVPSNGGAKKHKKKPARKGQGTR